MRTIDQNIIDKVRELTQLEKGSPSSRIQKIREELEKGNIDVNLGKLKNSEYLNFGQEAKEKLLIYFCFTHTTNKHLNKEAYITKKDIIKYLGFKSSQEKEILKEFTFSDSITCPQCGNKTPQNFKQLQSPKPIDTPKCIHCNHIIAEYIHAECECETCKTLIKHVEDYFHNLKSHIRSHIEEKFNTLKNNSKDMPEISERRLSWYAQKHSCELTKTEREIISYMPTCIEEILENWPDSITGLEKKGMLQRKRVFKELDSINSNVLDQVHKMIFSNLILGTENYQKYGQISDLSKLKVKFLRKHPDGYRYTGPKSSLFIIFDRLFPDCEVRELFYCDTTFDPYLMSDIYFDDNYKLNPYFFQDFNFDEDEIFDRAKIKPLFNIEFNSSVEKSLYLTLKEIYFNCLVAPNVRLSDFIKIESLKELFSNKEVEYLQYCIIDFVIYSKNGVPIKTIELQRGKHHDEKEWIRKDRLKRKALKFAGIPLQEYY